MAVSEFESIAVIGLGLIGGSLVKALKSKGYKGAVYGIDSDLDAVKKAYLAGVVDHKTGRLEEVIPKSELVVLATPVETYSEIVSMINPHLKAGTVLTDVGSVKGYVKATIDQVLMEHVEFVGGHPMVGSEKSGFDVAKAHLFENAYYFVMSEAGSKMATRKVEALIDIVGAKVVRTSEEKHDKIVARISHLPHLNAAVLVNLLGPPHQDFLNYAGGGFRDTTRIASGDPKMWQGIFHTNKTEMLAAIEAFQQELEAYKQHILCESVDQVVEKLEMAKSLREQIPSHLSDLIEPRHTLSVDVEDKPGMLAKVTAELASKSISIKDIEICHSRENGGGALKLGFCSREEKIQAYNVMINRRISCQIIG